MKITIYGWSIRAVKQSLHYAASLTVAEDFARVSPGVPL